MIQQLQKGWQRPGWLNYLVLPVSWLYQGVVGLRRILFRFGLKPVQRSAVPVIVVGNITVGGTGKTPIVIALAKHLQKQGWKPGLIARGYGGDSTTWPRLVSDGNSAKAVGDEPLVLSRSTGLPVAAGPIRVDNVRLLIERCQCDVVISDDGFQHFSLGRDLDLVVVDGARQFGNGWCLPAGPLRESMSGLARADMVILNGNADDGLQALRKVISGAGYSGKVFSSIAVPAGLYRLANPQEKAELAQFAQKTVRAIAGLGNPDRFSELLSGNEITHTRHFFPDHHDYTDDDFAFLDQQDIVIMTEKDAVKCADLKLPNETWVLQIQASLSPDCLLAIDNIIGKVAKQQAYTGAA